METTTRLPGEPRADGALAEQDAVFRKVGWRILPILILSYGLAYLDRVNISFAKLQMQSDLGFSNAAYGFGAGIFFLGYVLLEVPSNLLLARIGARRTLSRIMLLWGLASAAMVFVRNEQAFYILRFLLGVFEAGFGPGMLYYLTLWYGRSRRGQVMASVLLAGPMAGIVGGPLATLIMTGADGSLGLSGWQWLFLMEGLPTVLVGIVLFFCLCDGPDKAPWLNARERALIAAELAADAVAGHQHRFRDALRTPRIYGLALSYFCMIAGLYAVSFWLPTLLHAGGVEDTMTIGLLSSAPYVVAVVTMVLVGRHSDRKGERYRYSVGACLIAAAALAVTGSTLGNLPVSLAALTVATAATYAAYTVFWTIPAELLRGTAAAGGIALINSIGLLGGFLSPTVIGAVRDATGSLQGGLSAIAAGLALGGLLLLALRRSGGPAAEVSVAAAGRLGK
ncbi:MFS transporter [Azospirillum picis]|uniref:Sugar phosphate permease n=1 Tax=Azospirillum picis TaxID=488438 RepID=A0ABU0MW21_9PROT|nr:MFS transporter [Azospirillum picis]MBP2303403.1 sugar phosphate permease [Azospirillum picis]MDQ0537271.1 sugar phosphate permease [Azospirillum picis]